METFFIINNITRKLWNRFDMSNSKQINALPSKGTLAPSTSYHLPVNDKTEIIMKVLMYSLHKMFYLLNTFSVILGRNGCVFLSAIKDDIYPHRRYINILSLAQSTNFHLIVRPLLGAGICNGLYQTINESVTTIMVESNALYLFHGQSEVSHQIHFISILY